MKQRHQYLAEGLSLLGYKLIFVESGAKRNPKISDIPRIFSRVKKLFVKNSNSVVTKVKGNEISVVSPVVLPSTNVIFNFLNKHFFTKFLVKQIVKNCIYTETVVIAYPPTKTTLDMIHGISPATVIYDCVSNFESVPGMPKSVVEDELCLINRADIMVVDCDYLLNKFSDKSNDLRQVEPGVFTEHFYLEKQVSKIKRLCYFGLVSEKLDLELLYLLKDNGYVVDVIGESRVDIDLTRISSLTPSIAHEKLPSALSGYDALLLPYALTDYSMGVIPAKFFECFATGLPIVATDRENFKRYRECLVTGATNQEIVDKVGVYTDTEELRNKRLDIAISHDWNRKIDDFVEMIERRA